MGLNGRLSIGVVLALCVTAGAELKNGEYVERWPNGKTKISGAYKHGRRDGQWTWYYESGKVKETVRYIQERKQGKAETFCKSGKLLSRTVWRNDSKHGDYLEQTWVKKDDKYVRLSKTTGTYYKGLKDGAWVTVWSDGRKKKTRYIRGKLAK
ncbi:MAG: toxin-antitoxin system YwqK family antitoxin [Planctomycetota bacterium]|jgi:hypothetical protein